VSQRRKVVGQYGKGRSPTKFSYGYKDLAKLINCSVGAAKKHAQRGSFNPHYLMSVLAFIQTKLEQHQEKIKDASKDT